MTDVFISYSRHDGINHAQQLENYLYREQFAVWRDVRQLDPHQDFTADIEIAIENATHILVCVTKDTKRANSFVRREIQYALAIGKPVIPLRFEDITPHVSIINHEWVDFFDNWSDGFQRVCHILRDTHTTAMPAPRQDPYRDYLNALYKNIVRYLKQTVLGHVISLHADNTPDAVIIGAETSSVLPMAFFEMAGINDTAESTYRTFHDACEQHDRRILLLGEPGGGKTTTLFAFARDAVAHRLEDPDAPLPLLVPIATWNPIQRPSMIEWLASIIPVLNETQLSDLLNGGKALLLLDGLDELGLERENPETEERFNPILPFMQMLPANNQIIVTCRVREYESLPQRIALNGAVTLQPLDDLQMQQYLTGASKLWEVLSRDDELREVARTPLLLNLLAYAFQDIDPADLTDLREGALRDRIFYTFVDQSFQREARKPYVDLRYTREEIYARLGQIAVEDRIGYGDTDTLLHEHFADSEREEFLELMTSLHYLVVDAQGRYHFIHLLLRDFFAYHFALNCLEKQDTPLFLEQQAVSALGLLRDHRATPHLLDVVQNHHANMMLRTSVISAFGFMGDISIVPPLIAMCADRNEELILRGSAAHILGIYEDSRALDILVTIAKDHDEPRTLRTSAISALASIPGCDAADLLLILEDVDDADSVRASAAYALGYVGDEAILPALITALSDDAPPVRSGVAESLGYMRDPRAVQPLIDSLRDYARIYPWNKKRVCNTAAEALLKIGTPEAQAAVAEWEANVQLI